MNRDNFLFKIGMGLFVTALCLWLAIQRPSVSKKVTSSVHVDCETTKGPVKILVVPNWSPLGAQRFLQLVEDGYFTKLPLFRCIPNFVCQMGPSFQKNSARVYDLLPDDPTLPELRDFKPGYISFAGYGTNSRATHVFIALSAVSSLGTQPWETPFGYVTDSSFEHTVKRFDTSYGETEPSGHGPVPEKITAPGGEEYLKQNFPKLDYFLSCVKR